MKIDLARGNVRKGDCYTIADGQQSYSVEITLVEDKDTNRVIKYLILESSDLELVPMGAVYTLNLDKNDTNHVIYGELTKRPVSNEELTRLEYERTVHTFICTLIIKHGTLKTETVMEALRSQNFYQNVPDSTLRKKVNRICNSGRYGMALRATGGIIAVDKNKLANTVKKPSLLSTKKQVSVRVITEAISTILKELGYDIVE